MDLMDIWDRVQGVRPSSSVEDRWVWVPGSHDSFLSPVRGRLFVLIVVGLVGRVYYGMGEILLSTPFVLGWTSLTKEPAQQ